MPFPSIEECIDLIRSNPTTVSGTPETLVIPVWAQLLDDQLSPVLAYRRLVAPDARDAHSFLFESVEGGERQGRHSILGAQPAIDVIVRAHDVDIIDRRSPHPTTTRSQHADPLDVPRSLTAEMRLLRPPVRRGRPLPACFLGGWVGYAAYDSVRYAEPEKLAFAHAPKDDRHLPELHFAFYDGVVVFDHVDKCVFVVQLMTVKPGARDADIRAAHTHAVDRAERRIETLQSHSRPMPSGRLDRTAPNAASTAPRSNLNRAQHADMLAKAMEYIKAGDIFQVVLGQRFERTSPADPFDVYRALRTVNPSPYMVYLQAAGSILIASSPEILCRVRTETRHGVSAKVVTNRPLAGTRPRGATTELDLALERELLADPKERAEHIMLVDLGRNDVGHVARPGSIQLPALMHIERYSHVMHISSTVTGELRDGLDSWDALRAALPVGTISGAPKVRAMQIIDELEPVRRGPYGGGIGCIGLDLDMDIALALRTMVVPMHLRTPAGDWTYHLQASGGIVADSNADAEYQETVNKAAALARAIDVAEQAFGTPQTPP